MSTRRCLPRAKSEGRLVTTNSPVVTVVEAQVSPPAGAAWLAIVFIASASLAGPCLAANRVSSIGCVENTDLRFGELRRRGYALAAKSDPPSPTAPHGNHSTFS
jgi:hypothetical protein